MDAKKINSRIKKPATLTGVVFGLIFVIGIFTGMFLWLSHNTSNSGVNLDSKYTEAFNQLNGSTQAKLSNNINDIKDSFNNIKEADSTWQVAWNSLLGLSSTLKLPINFMATALEAMNISMVGIDYVPEWFKVLAGIGITALILFIVIAILKGEAKM